MARVEEAGQRGRWWPLPVFHRKVRTDATAIGTTEYQPSPIPATNGHAPIAIGRTQNMLSPVKAIIAGALVVALGGLFLIGRPFAQQQDPHVGADSDPAAAMAEVSVGPGVSYFTGTSECTSEAGERTIVDGVAQSHHYSTCEYTTTDDRFNGTVEVDNTVYSFGPDGGPWTSEEALVTEEGAWRGTSQGVYDLYGVSPLGIAGKVFHYGQSDYVGEGAYEGYVAHLYFAGNDEMHSLTGWITSSE
jgi:hypothetical protein